MKLMTESDTSPDAPIYGDPTTTLPVLPRTVVVPEWIRPQSVLWVWVGILMVAASFGLIAYTWVKVSGESLVYKQLPYFVSGGLTAVLLAIGGLLLVNVSTRQADAFKRERQSERMIVLLEALERTLASVEGE